MIVPDKWQQLYVRMSRLGISEEDLSEKFILGSGAGGQKINKTSSCVWIKHLPTKLTVKCQSGRSQEMNRYYARQRLCEKIAEVLQIEKTKRQQAIEKVRRQKKRRTRRTKEKMLADKHHQTKRKSTRKKPEMD